MLEALEALARLRRRVARVRGVLNGTTNFVLEALAEGAELEDALAAARARGLAEADATRDLDGRDAADKLCVIAGVLGLGAVHVEREPLPADLAARARRAADAGHRLRQVAELEPAGRRTPHVGAARPRATVRLVALAPDDPLFALPGAANAALLADAAGRVERVHGVGAGRWPTAEAVLGDLLALARARRRSPAPHLRAPVATLERSPSPLHGTSSCSPSP
jgi:homoserine dehydrogenase